MQDMQVEAKVEQCCLSWGLLPGRSKEYWKENLVMSIHNTSTLIEAVHPACIQVPSSVSLLRARNNELNNLHALYSLINMIFSSLQSLVSTDSRLN